MNKLYMLTKILLKNSSGEKSKKKNNRAYSISKLVLPLLGILFMIPVVNSISKMYDVFANTNQQDVIINAGFSITIVVIFIFSIPYILTTFYFTKDIDVLLPLPFKSYEIVGAKFITVLIYQYLMALLFLVPSLGVYGYKSSSGIVYWITAIFLFLILPIIPLVLSSLFSMVVMRFTNLGKHKDTLRVVGGIFSIVIFLGINLLRSNESSQGKTLELIALGNNSLVKTMNSVLPIAKWGTRSLVGNSINEAILSLFLVVLASVLFIILFIIIGQKLYLNSIIGSSESFSKREKLDDYYIGKNVSKSSKFKTYVLKEMRIVLRTPAFLLNCIVPGLIFPIFLLIGIYTKLDSYFSKETISAIFSNKEITGLVLTISFAGLLLLSSRTMIASTAISREGQNMFINKYIPISYRKQILAKILPDTIMNSISTLLILLILVFIIKIPIMIAILIFIIGLLASIISSGLGMIKEINNPILNWDNEQKAVKQNKNAISIFFTCLILGGLIVFLAIKFRPSATIAVISIIIISLVAITGIFNHIFTTGEKRYSEIE
ncbi:putative ABC transporter permease subunit [Clostridium oceanicum]|uniref:ABC transporter permease n=1 Tax=Clostridium oceanicum TaxID=1543 RepID=A0ABP3UMI0_9CLOT